MSMKTILAGLWWKLAFVTEGDCDSANSLNSDNLDAGISIFGGFLVFLGVFLVSF